jgi:hypothetical protein
MRAVSSISIQTGSFCRAMSRMASSLAWTTPPGVASPCRTIGASPAPLTKNLSGPAGGFFPTGIAWYRKSFSAARQRRPSPHVYVVFDGVMANSDVWINGFHLGHRPNGYVSFFYDLTGHLQFGPAAHNVIAVRCDTQKQPASRWYEGGGIYRPVRLVLLQDVHLEPWSTFRDYASGHCRQRHCSH